MPDNAIARDNVPDLTIGHGRTGYNNFQAVDDSKHDEHLSFGSDVSPTKQTPPDETRHESVPSIRAVGTAPDDVYAKILAPWRVAIRRAVIWNLHNESDTLANMQKMTRTPFLDKYFVYTSMLGSHTFFMVGLPILFFFGYAGTARGLVFVLAMGVYTSSFLKDLICAPRPYSPPVTRLTIGSHHLEYGFPSTHSTNSVSIALWAFSLVRAHYLSSSFSTFMYSVTCLFLGIYVLSIVFGRMYTGMHSFTDCVAGVALGYAVFVFQGLSYPVMENWIISATSSGSAWRNWLVPGAIATVTALMVHRHPQPAEDCPCFEDAIAFLSVVAGISLAQWGAILAGFPDERLSSVMPGSPFALFSSGLPFAEAWRASSLWWGTVLLKLTVGILLVFVWRIVAKFILHNSLPALFRLISYKVLPRLESINVIPKGSGLPNRRFYTPATEYDGAVPEGGLHPIPSVIDLSSTVHETGGINYRDSEYGADVKRRRGKDVKRDARHQVGRGGKPGGHKEGSEYLAPFGRQNGSIYGTHRDDDDRDNDEPSDEVVVHYDADVITKMIVYAGIGMFGSTIIPIMFEVLGWGIRVS